MTTIRSLAGMTPFTQCTESMFRSRRDNVKRPQIVTLEGAVAGGASPPAAAVRFTNYDERTNGVVDLGEIDALDDPAIGARGTLRFKTFVGDRPKTVMILDPDGRVGVGTEAPEHLFHVSGKIAAGGLIGVSAQPGVAVGKAAGDTAVVSLDGSDTAGRVSISTGNVSSVAGDPIVDVTFSAAYSTPPSVILTPANQNAGSVQPPPHTVVSLSGFSVRITSKVGTLIKNTLYKWSYVVIQ